MPTVLVTGANRGLGLEFARQYLAEGWRVIALCRNPEQATDLRGLAGEDTLAIHEVDVSNFEAIDAVAERIRDVPIDLLINNAGLFGPKRTTDDDLRQTFGHMDYDIWSDLLRVNTMAPLKMAEALADNVLAGDQKKIITITSTLGSIAEGDPGYYAYRTSKAAVNMAMATLARDLAPKGVTVLVLNPGWVATDMGGAGAALSPEQSITKLRKIIESAPVAPEGAFIDHDGRAVPW